MALRRRQPTNNGAISAAIAGIQIHQALTERDVEVKRQFADRLIKNVEDMPALDARARVRIVEMIRQARP